MLETSAFLPYTVANPVVNTKLPAVDISFAPDYL